MSIIPGQLAYYAQSHGELSIVMVLYELSKEIAICLHLAWSGSHSEPDVYFCDSINTRFIDAYKVT